MIAIDPPRVHPFLFNAVPLLIMLPHSRHSLSRHVHHADGSQIRGPAWCAESANRVSESDFRQLEGWFDVWDGQGRFEMGRKVSRS
jgi:hypothetical protein